MLSKIYRHVNIRRFIPRQYWLLGILVALTVVLTNIYPLKGQMVALSQPSSDVQEELVDLEMFSDTIAKLESRWQNEYEGYFGRNFSNQSRSVKQIAERLQEVHEQTNLTPAVIWAVPQDDFLQLILVTPQGQSVIKKVWGANRERLTKRIDELEIAISDRQSLDYLPPARIIYNWILRPLEPYLASENVDTLLLCTGSKLRSFPFAVLHDGEKFVVEKYNLARIPAFNLTDTSYQAKSERQVLAMGASKFVDLPPLPGVAIELETIVPKLWSGRKIVEQDFTVDNLQNAHQQEGFDIIHLASHSVFSSGSPENSFIQFSDRKLNLAQIADLNLDLPQVDLLVLSACETALGDKDAEYGFAGLAMQAGVKSALASLWSVDDVGTVLLMSEFYQQLKSTAIKSAALSKAQVNLLKQKVFVESAQIEGLEVEVNLSAITSQEQAQNFTHPFYWSGFTIIGNPW